MKSSKPSDIFKSFKDLKFLFDKKALSTTRRGENDIEVHRVVKIDIKKESQLFFGCNGWCKTVAVASLSLQNRYSKPKFFSGSPASHGESGLSPSPAQGFVMVAPELPMYSCDSALSLNG